MGRCADLILQIHLQTHWLLQMYSLGLLVVWYSSSLGCLLSILAGPSSALITTVGVMLVLGGFLNGKCPVCVCCGDCAYNAD